MTDYETTVEDGRQSAKLRLGATEWLRSVQKFENENQQGQRRIRGLNHQVRRLRNELNEDVEECRQLAEETADRRRELERLRDILAQGLGYLLAASCGAEKRKKEDAETLVTTAKRGKAVRQKEIELLRQEIGSYSVRIRNIRPTRPAPPGRYELQLQQQQQQQQQQQPPPKALVCGAGSSSLCGFLSFPLAAAGDNGEEEALLGASLVCARTKSAREDDGGRDSQFPASEGSVSGESPSRAHAAAVAAATSAAAAADVKQQQKLNEFVVCCCLLLLLLQRACQVRSQRPRPGDPEWYSARTRGRPVFSQQESSN
ncbi:hypothetical protein Efla_003594 [Eimeria flavescens]